VNKVIKKLENQKKNNYKIWDGPIIFTKNLIVTIAGRTFFGIETN